MNASTRGMQLQASVPDQPMTWDTVHWHSLQPWHASAIHTVTFLVYKACFGIHVTGTFNPPSWGQ